MRILVTLFIFMVVTLSACSNGENQENNSLEEVPEPLDVVINTPEKIQVNQEYTIEAEVVQGSEKIIDADEVKFEIWKDGHENHEMLEAHNEKNGVYSIKKSFSEGGKYYIVAHTTASRMHSMPKKEISVEPVAAFASEEHQKSGTEDVHERHHNSQVKFDFHVPSPIKSNHAAELVVHLKQNEQPVTGASVNYEIWEENQTAHEFISALEGSGGIYSIPFTFKASGNYNVKIHVEKGKIHEHTDEKVKVN